MNRNPLKINCHRCVVTWRPMSESRKRHTEPGRADRDGISYIEFFKRFPDDLAAEAWFEEQRWPNGTACPKCGSIDVARVKSRRPMPWRCRDCRGYFSVRYGTVMQSSRLGLQVWLLAIYLLSTGLKGTSSLKLRRDLGVTQKTAWYLAHRIREAMRIEDFDFCGPIEIDEAYFGGKEKNKHRHKRMKAAGGTVGKMIVLGIKDRCSNRVSVRVIPNTKAVTFMAMVSDHAAPGTEVFSDEHRSYLRLPKLGYKHSSVRHKVGQYVDGLAHTNGIESHWANMKRGYHGTYHQMSWEHLQRYADEFSHRHNVRSMDTGDQMADMVARMDHKTLPYKELIANGTRARRAADRG